MSLYNNNNNNKELNSSLSIFHSLNNSERNALPKHSREPVHCDLPTTAEVSANEEEMGANTFVRYAGCLYKGWVILAYNYTYAKWLPRESCSRLGYCLCTSPINERYKTVWCNTSVNIVRAVQHHVTLCSQLTKQSNVV